MSLRIKLYLLVFVVAFAGCNSYEKILKSNDLNLKLTKANEYYDKEKFSLANELYGQLAPVLKGTRNYEPLSYKYAYSFYKMKEYLPASYHFKIFTDNFPASPDAQEAEFLHSLCLYKMAPKASLEQINTEKAMEAFQSFINTYPNSKHITEANNYIDEGRAKLETKDADAAKLYFNIGRHRAASVAYRSVMRNYPESASADFYQYMIVRSLYLYAQQSIETKQEERFANTVTAYREMADLYPQSTFLTEAKALSSQADASIIQIKKSNP